jgi:hypothetical protein
MVEKAKAPWRYSTGRRRWLLGRIEWQFVASGGTTEASHEFLEQFLEKRSTQECNFQVPWRTKVGHP